MPPGHPSSTWNRCGKTWHAHNQRGASHAQGCRTTNSHSRPNVALVVTPFACFSTRSHKFPRYFRNWRISLMLFPSITHAWKKTEQNQSLTPEVSILNKLGISVIHYFHVEIWNYWRRIGALVTLSHIASELCNDIAHWHVATRGSSLLPKTHCTRWLKYS